MYWRWVLYQKRVLRPVCAMQSIEWLLQVNSGRQRLEGESVCDCKFCTRLFQVTGPQTDRTSFLLTGWHQHLLDGFQVLLNNRHMCVGQSLHIQFLELASVTLQR